MGPIQNVIGQQRPVVREDPAPADEVIECEEEKVIVPPPAPDVEIIMPLDSKALKLLKTDPVRNPLLDPNRKSPK